MQVDVLFFGHLTDVTGVNRVSFDGVADTDQLLRDLKSRYPRLAEVPYAVAVGMDFINGNTSLNDKDTIALLPPYSGG